MPRYLNNFWLVKTVRHRAYSCPMTTKTKKREHWGSKFGFIMAAAGSAIGLGTMWKFPYMLGEGGGGAFVLLYTLFTFFIGIPVFIAELLLGRVGQKGTVGTFVQIEKGHTPWTVIGWLGIITSLVTLAYYCVVGGWGIHYLLMTLTQFYGAKSPDQIRGTFDILFASPGLNIVGQLAFLGITAGVVYKGIREGIEHWSKILTPALLILLIVLLFYNFSLSGFGKACHFVFWPDFSKLSPSGILASLGLAFFTLSVGQGIMLTFGSYMDTTTDVPKTSLIVAAMDIVVSVLCALVIFPIIFTFNFPPTEGIGLVFKAIPVLFAQLPGTLLLSFMFFLLLIFTALTSSVSLLEVSVANWMDMFGLTRKQAVWVSTGVIFLLGIPCALSGAGWLFPYWESVYGMNFFNTMVYLVAHWLLPVSGFLIAFYAGWRFNKAVAEKQFKLSSTMKYLFGIWWFFIKFIAPLAILLIILQSAGLFL